MKPELSVLNKKRKTNGIKQCKVVQGNLDITRTWGRVQSNKRHAYSLGAMHVQPGDLRCTSALVMGMWELLVVTPTLGLTASDDILSLDWQVLLTCPWAHLGSYNG